MKRLIALSILLSAFSVAIAQTTPDTTGKTPPIVKELPPAPPNRIIKEVDNPPEYPGGTEAFSKYISKNLKYPEVARMIGIEGKLILSFVVGRDGKITDITPVNCIGAGCEAEAVKVLQESPNWKPGFQSGRPVRVQYYVPIGFSVEKGKVSMKELRASNYGFVFNIKDKLYTLDEAQEIIGRSFRSEDVKIAEPFYNDGDNPRYAMPDKKEVYLVVMKN
ncbi:energy transducer TonB [Mucilaginibacter pedocola]|uniref:TonB C-terminal domain-containing protein n=1 Tax=Mucilaginibacter pedocola TaxID=1792845 RepID=A0A1S9PI50_9SPHI|nr:energy transducer TonB [Mucilaginibacter pedocola]OOQ60228.1 hypothetical protein BC343_26075 [Mucilaginibacter pedocola]